MKTASNSFHSARPVWIAGMADTMNVGAGFLAEFLPASGKTTLRLTSAGRFRFFVNGVFVAHGPERSAHGHARVEEWELSLFLKDGANHIAIEVVAPRVNTFYTIDEPGFLLPAPAADMDLGIRCLFGGSAKKAT